MPRSTLRARRYAVVDLETTGASAVYDRITEIAIVSIDDGRIGPTFNTLVQPGLPIPAFITRLTGIDDRMVAGQPRLAELVPRIEALLAGRTLVAHNASFDHAFLKQGFARAGVRLEIERLCTVRLARRLLPGLSSYRLDAVLGRLALTCTARHRAAGDAEATARLFLELLDLAERAGVRDLDRLQRAPIAGRPRRGVDEGIVQSLPDGPGVYLLKDGEGQVLYVGKSRQVRGRVREHLRGDCPAQPRLKRRIRLVVDVEAFETGSELEALFLESRLIKHYQPEANVVGRAWQSYAFLQVWPEDDYPRFEVTHEPAPGATLFGPLRRAGRVAAAFEALQDRLGLRRCREPIRPGQAACPLLDLKKCLAPCARPAVRPAYRAAVDQVLGLLAGTDDRPLRELAERRDALAAGLRFEEAAELRDHLRELERLLGDQRRLRAVARRNLVVVAPSRRAGQRELFVIRAGRLVEQRRVALPARADTLARLLRRHFETSSDPWPIEREAVDEMRHLEGWLRRERATLRCIEVEPGELGPALAELREALRGGAVAAIV